MFYQLTVKSSFFVYFSLLQAPQNHREVLKLFVMSIMMLWSFMRYILVHVEKEKLYPQFLTLLCSLISSKFYSFFCFCVWPWFFKGNHCTSTNENESHWWCTMDTMGRCHFSTLRPRQTEIWEGKFHSFYSLFHALFECTLFWKKNWVYIPRYRILSYIWFVMILWRRNSCLSWKKHLTFDFVRKFIRFFLHKFFFLSLPSSS